MASLIDAPDVLKKIAAYKADEVTKLKSHTSIEALRKQAKPLPAPRGFHSALRKSGPSLIAEVKKASPSKGVIREDFDPIAIAKAYERGGASCLSVLTDGPGFQGSPEIFAQVRAATNLPLLRKDFMLEPIQIAESAAMGADAILVILAMIDDKSARGLMDEAHALGLDALVETHDTIEIDRAVSLGATLIGINNRDLRTFHTTLDTFAANARRVPTSATLIAESGVFTSDDILRLTEDGADGFLVGESLMRQEDVEWATRILLGRKCLRIRTEYLTNGHKIVLSPYQKGKSWKKHENLTCWNNDEKVWSAELPNTSGADSYVEFKINKLSLTAWTFSCHRCEISLENGKILESEFTK